MAKRKKAKAKIKVADLKGRIILLEDKLSDALFDLEEARESMRYLVESIREVLGYEEELESGDIDK